MTKEVISFAYEEDEIQIDFIPLAEVDYVKEMSDVGEFRRASSAEMCRDEDEGHTLQIATSKEGHNAGRLYYLQTETHAEMEQLKRCIQEVTQ